MTPGPISVSLPYGLLDGGMKPKHTLLIKSRDRGPVVMTSDSESQGPRFDSRSLRKEMLLLVVVCSIPVHRIHTGT